MKLASICLFAVFLSSLGFPPITEKELKQTKTTATLLFNDEPLINVVRYLNNMFPHLHFDFAGQHKSLGYDPERRVTLSLNSIDFHKVLGLLSALYDIRYVITDRDIIIYPRNSKLDGPVFTFKNKPKNDLPVIP